MEGNRFIEVMAVQDGLEGEIYFVNVRQIVSISGLSRNRTVVNTTDSSQFVWNKEISEAVKELQKA